MRYREVLTFPIALRRDTAQPLHEQIAQQISAAIEAGAVARGGRIPSTRTLAESLGVSRGVAAEAYDRLHSLGYLVSRPGAGTFVWAERYMAQRTMPRPTPHSMVDFTPGMLCVEAFPLRAWRSAWRQATYHLPDLPPPLGLPVLRSAITEHLRRTRGLVMPSHSHEVVITNGTDAALRLLAGRVDRDLIEINRDAVFQPASGPVTVLLGDFAELLTPSLQVGYALVPRAIAGVLSGEQPSPLIQLALAELLQRGVVLRQMHRLSRLFAARRAIVHAALEPVVGVSLSDIAEGIVLIGLPVPLPNLGAELRQAGVKVPPLEDGRSLVLGYGHVADKVLRRGIDQVVKVLCGSIVSGRVRLPN